MSAAIKNDRCARDSGTPVIAKGDPISVGGQCCGGKGPGVFKTDAGARCTLCVILYDVEEIHVVEDEALHAEAREWDGEADDYIERARRLEKELEL